jgi:O-antigen ligase
MRNSMTEASPANTPESSAVRLMAWKASAAVISRNPVFGTGTGDVKDELMKEYLAGGYDLLYKQKVNAHNQFLQTTATLGIPGLLLLCGIILAMAIKSIRNRDLLLMCFLIIVIVNAMVESFIEVQAGVIFFAFFYGILNSDDRAEELIPVSGGMR